MTRGMNGGFGVGRGAHCGTCCCQEHRPTPRCRSGVSDGLAFARTGSQEVIVNPLWKN